MPQKASVSALDDAVFGFDNNAGALTSSPALIEAYIAAAAKISRAALGHGTDVQQKIYTAPSDYSQVNHEEGTMFVLTMHPHISGHRSRIVALEQLIAHIEAKGAGKVWWATHGAVAEYVRPLLDKPVP